MIRKFTLSNGQSVSFNTDSVPQKLSFYAPSTGLTIEAKTDTKTLIQSGTPIGYDCPYQQNVNSANFNLNNFLLGSGKDTTQKLTVTITAPANDDVHDVFVTDDSQVLGRTLYVYQNFTLSSGQEVEISEFYQITTPQFLQTTDKQVEITHYVKDGVTQVTNSLHELVMYSALSSIYHVSNLVDASDGMATIDNTGQVYDRVKIRNTSASPIKFFLYKLQTA